MNPAMKNCAAVCKPVSLPRLAGTLAGALLLSACSLGQLVVRGTTSILDSGLDAMNRESDLQLAREAMPANLKLLEGMLIEDPHNTTLRLYAAEGFYGYSFGFIEPEDTGRAKVLYRRCYTHARAALAAAGLTLDPETASADELAGAVGTLDRRAVPALFWTASCLGKWIDLNRDAVSSVASLANAAALMQRALELDEGFYHAGPHLFFGVYYGGRPPLLGGDFARASRHFARADELNAGNLLMVDVLQAQYLDRQRLDRDAFHTHLRHVLDAPADLDPELMLINGVAKAHAARLLEYETDWF
jgi:hypothetical protein